MTHRREVKFAAWLVAAVAIAGIAYFVGGSLKPDEAPYYVFQTDAPAYDQPAAFAGTSQGGFTGFGELDDGDSRTVIAGRVVDMTDKTLTLQAASGQQVLLTVGAKPGVSQIVDGAMSELQPGVKVKVRLADGSLDTIAAVLIEGQASQ
ncbi:MAG TPA: hypothetical protein VFY10_06570 [Dehalococcoidia bacterium]|nr:hypothetical protein [Dehalococcoidia bacterium]